MRRWTGGAVARGEVRVQRRVPQHCGSRSCNKLFDHESSRDPFKGKRVTTSVTHRAKCANPWETSELQNAPVDSASFVPANQVYKGFVVPSVNRKLAAIKKKRKLPNSKHTAAKNHSRAAKVKPTKSFDHQPIPQLTNGHLSSRTKTGAFVIRSAKVSDAGGQPLHLSTSADHKKTLSIQSSHNTMRISEPVCFNDEVAPLIIDSSYISENGPSGSTFFQQDNFSNQTIKLSETHGKPDVKFPASFPAHHHSPFSFTRSSEDIHHKLYPHPYPVMKSPFNYGVPMYLQQHSLPGDWHLDSESQPHNSNFVSAHSASVHSKPTHSQEYFNNFVPISDRHQWVDAHHVEQQHPSFHNAIRLRHHPQYHLPDDSLPFDFRDHFTEENDTKTATFASMQMFPYRSVTSVSNLPFRSNISSSSPGAYQSAYHPPTSPFAFNQKVYHPHQDHNQKHCHYYPSFYH